MDGDAAHHADQQGGKHDAPEAAEPADHHHDEGDDHDVGAHGRLHDGDRGEEGATHRRHGDAEHDDGRHVRLQPDAERRHHVGPLDARAHDAAERRLVQQQPDADENERDDAEQDEAVAREQEVTDDHRAFQALWHHRRERCGAPDDADRLLGDHREAEGDEQAENRIGGVEAAQDEALEQDAEQADRDRRDRDRRIEADVIGQGNGGIGAERRRRRARG